MGYNLSIGEFAVDIVHDERRAQCRVKSAGPVKGAPVNSSGHKGNIIYPSYSTWANFARSVGLYSLFYAPRSEDDSNRSDVWWVDCNGEEQEGLLSRHPGSFALSETHLVAFREAKKSYLELPEPRPGICNAEDAKVWGGDVGADYNLRRLDWLIFWTDWALQTCDYPTFANS